MFLQLQSVSGWFHSIVAELNSCNRDFMAHKPENIYCLPFTEIVGGNSLPSPSYVIVQIADRIFLLFVNLNKSTNIYTLR